MTKQVLVSVERNTGIITLNRPDAINALDQAMITAIRKAFDDFQNDAAIAAIVLEGNGPRGFCAGGDVRAVRALALGGDLDSADGFFAAEYALNEAIACATKPIIALTSGFVMGGGIGLAGHARYRITTQKASFAMPEGAIGFVCDIGINAILKTRAPHHALTFLLSGSPVGAGDAIALGLTDFIISEQDMSGLRKDLMQLENDGNLNNAIKNLVEKYKISAAATPFINEAEIYKEIIQADCLSSMMEGLAELTKTNSAAVQLQDLLLTRCPTSLAAIWHNYHAARRTEDLSDIFQNDLALARWMVRRPDFHNGVKAVLIDKGTAAQWSPSTIAEVDDNSLRDLLA